MLLGPSGDLALLVSSRGLQRTRRSTDLVVSAPRLVLRSSRTLVRPPLSLSVIVLSTFQPLSLLTTLPPWLVQRQRPRRLRLKFEARVTPRTRSERSSSPSRQKAQRAATRRRVSTVRRPVRRRRRTRAVAGPRQTLPRVRQARGPLRRLPTMIRATATRLPVPTTTRPVWRRFLAAAAAAPVRRKPRKIRQASSPLRRRLAIVTTVAPSPALLRQYFYRGYVLSASVICHPSLNQPDHADR